MKDYYTYLVKYNKALETWHFTEPLMLNKTYESKSKKRFKVIKDLNTLNESKNDR